MEKKIGALIVAYFVIGLIFAVVYALFYHWPPLSFFSPGFYVVLLSWPIQLPGFLSDFQFYGIAGKTLL